MTLRSFQKGLRLRRSINRGLLCFGRNRVQGIHRIVGHVAKLDGALESGAEYRTHVAGGPPLASLDEPIDHMLDPGRRQPGKRELADVGKHVRMDRLVVACPSGWFSIRPD